MTTRVFVFLAGVIVALAAAGGIFAAFGGGGDVRVAVRKHADERVEVAVQQRDAESWAARQLPEQRFLPSDAEDGRWYVSSGVDIDATATFPSEDADFYCLVTHEHPGDEGFWDLIREGAHDRRWKLGLDVEVRVVGSPDVSEQAALVGECVADGAAGIGATLADPDGMRAALQAAAEAGVIIHTFNSGLEHFESVGATRHISIDELNAGEVAAELFIEAGVSGRVLCVIHEASNVGLEERCDGFESAYDDPVERLRVHESGVGDLAATQATIAERLRSGSEVGGVITLNSIISLAALEAIRAESSSAALATFDQNPAILQAIADGEALFAIDTAPFWQSWITLSSLRGNINGTRSLKAQFGVAPEEILGKMSILLRPRITDQQNAQAWIDVQRHLRSEFSGEDQ